MDTSIMTLANHWLERDPDPQTRDELQTLISTEKHQELSRRFSGRLQFGTAGLRGLVGAGSNRMNTLVIQETTTGLGHYLQRTEPQSAKKGVVVGYDGRIHSKIFAEEASRVLAALGFRVYLGQSPLPTPICAFALQRLGAAAGIVVTASHNPPDYNGYKVFWENGAQIIPPHDVGIASAIEEASRAPIESLDIKDPDYRALVQPLDDDVIAAYHQGVQTFSNGEHEGRASFSIAYTPLHGVGAPFIEKTLRDAGFSNLHTVESQREPDGSFPTVNFPNPEEPGALDAVLALARETNADLVIANDPDADRLAIAVPLEDGSYQPLTGNQVGVLLGDHCLQKNPQKTIVATTMVSSRMLGRLAKRRGAHYAETLTGFKWIANTSMLLENQHPGLEFGFGYEEALGYTIGSLVRDKDGVSAALVFAELAYALKQNGQNVFDRLRAIQEEIGIFVTHQETIALDPHATGPAPGDRIRKMLPQSIAGQAITKVRDLKNPAEHKDLPASDVLIFYTEDDSRIIIRPSGTEPKLKCYYEIYRDVDQVSFTEAQSGAQQALRALVKKHQSELSDILNSPA